MTKESFCEYIINVFYPWCLQNNIEFPILMYCDGHTSHVTIPLLSFCRGKQIELLILYPHSTHITQPLDISFFGPFKTTVWKDTNRKWKLQNNKRGVKKQDFPKVLKQALDSWENENKVVISGFKASGLYPYNPDIVEYSVLKKKKKTKKNSEEGITEKAASQKSDQEIIESYIPEEILSQFANNQDVPNWTGNLKLDGLYKLWLKMKGTSDVQVLGMRELYLF